MKSKILLLSTTAVVALLASPAFAQSVTQKTFSLTDPVAPATTGTGSGNVSQSSGNQAVISAPGTTVTSVTGQIANNQLNAVGNGAAVSFNDGFAINQAAGGGFTYTDLNTVYNVTGTINQNALNSTSATSIAPAVSTAYAGGNQAALNAINSANIAPAIGSAGSISQVLGTATVNSLNTMAATVSNGNATIQGSNGGGAGFQNAVASLNAANVLMGAGLTGAPATSPTLSLGLMQKLQPGVSVNATNGAVANSQSSSPVLDPSVRDLSQTSTVGLNQLGVAAASYTTGTGSSAVTTIVPSLMNLDGSQSHNGTGQTSPAVTIGNAAVAYTGPASSTYNLTGSALGNGTSVVSGVTQQASFGLNGIAGGAGVSMSFSNAADAPNGFKQSYNGSQASLTGPVSGTPAGSTTSTVDTGIINLAAARTNAGSASVLGSASALTQGFNSQINSISTGGAATGIVTQTSNNAAQTGLGTTLGQPATGYSNVSMASALAGPAKLASVSQSMGQSFNSFSASGGGQDLLLTQTSSTMNVASNNVQKASGTTAAEIIGGVQAGSVNLNTAALGGAQNVNLGQTSTNATLGVSNTQEAAGSIKNNILGATQLGSTNLNVATVGSLANSGLGTSQVMQTAVGATINNTNALKATSSTFNASVSGFQQSTSAVNVVK